MKQFVYCPLCAGALVDRQIECAQRLVCTECGWIHYRNPIPVVVAVALNGGGQVLLVRRGVEPARGSWALPGGFIEAGEEPAVACARELLEETALVAGRIRVIDALHQRSVLYGSVIVLGYQVHVTNAEAASPGDDAMETRWVANDAVPKMPFESYDRILQKWRATMHTLQEDSAWQR